MNEWTIDVLLCISAKSVFFPQNFSCCSVKLSEFTFKQKVQKCLCDLVNYAIHTLF